MMFHYHFPYIFHMLTLCFFFSVQVFYPKENFNNPLILDLIFRQVDYIIYIQLFLLFVHLSPEIKNNPHLPCSLFSTYVYVC